VFRINFRAGCRVDGSVVANFARGTGDFIGDDIATAPRIVLWSLWCALISYNIYTLLLVVFRRIGLLPVIVSAFILSYVVILGHWTLTTNLACPRIRADSASLPA
jgi:hypothetical protein